MRKFWILLEKEIRELLTMQVIAPLLVTALIFFALGNILSNEQKKAAKPSDIVLVDQDNTPTSAAFIDLLRQSNLNVQAENKPVADALADTKSEGKTALLVIPKEFESGLKSGEPRKIQLHTVIRNFSALGGKDYGNLVTSLGLVNEKVSNQLILSKLPSVDPSILKNPITPDEFVVVGDRQANVSPNVIMGFVMQQTQFIPIILFFVIIFASQMIATAIANEKENKTLETLLTAPVKRNAIVIAKMAGAGLIALISSVVYIIGFRSYIDGLTGGAKAGSDIAATINNLGLTLTPQSYVYLGISLFVGILIALSISLILGAFAEDVKSVAGLTMPIMVLVMIPYFLTLFLDINTLSPALRYLTYAIPFSHVFMAAPNLFLHNYTAVILGILYELVWFVVAVAIAAKIFSSDKIVTMKLNFSRKKL